jgi:hypothetical protein
MVPGRGMVDASKSGWLEESHHVNLSFVGHFGDRVVSVQRTTYSQGELGEEFSGCRYYLTELSRSLHYLAQFCKLNPEG